MSHHVIEYSEQCKACKGTGLYVGMAERTGSAVVCYKCKGMGRVETRIEYVAFEGRVARPETVRVFQTNPGIVIGADDGLGLSDFGGMPYADWDAGKPFPLGSEMRRYTCPYRWYQPADSAKISKCEVALGGMRFSDCTQFGVKDLCWERWDKEFGGKE